MRPHLLDVDGGYNYFDVVQRKLGALCDYLSINGNERASIVVQSISVATLLIGIEIDTARLRSTRNN